MDVDKDIFSIAKPIFFSLFATSLNQPIIHCRTLMQLGYEPNSPYLGHSLKSLLRLGPKVLKYPSIFEYFRAIADKIGWTGLFTIGLPSKILYINSFSLISDSIYNHVMKTDGTEEDEILNTNKDLKEYIGEVSVLVLSRISGVVISYPFELIMIRQIANVIEEPANFPSMFEIFKDILYEEGISGFYSGLSARVIGEVLTVTISGAIAFLVNRYILDSKTKNEDKDVTKLTPAVSSYIACMGTYHITVISTLLAVSNSRLSCAVPLSSFTDAFSYLKEQRGLARGSSLFWRCIP